MIERVEVMCDSFSDDRSGRGITVETRRQAERMVGNLLIKLLLAKVSGQPRHPIRQPLLFVAIGAIYAVAALPLDQPIKKKSYSPIPTPCISCPSVDESNPKSELMNSSKAFQSTASSAIVSPFSSDCDVLNGEFEGRGVVGCGIVLASGTLDLQGCEMGRKGASKCAMCAIWWEGESKGFF